MNLAMHEEPSKMQIHTEMLKGSMMRRFSSNVGVEPVGSGKCRLEMSLFMQPMIFVPFGIRGMVGSQVGAELGASLISSALPFFIASSSGQQRVATQVS